MTGILTDFNGRTHALPELFSWELINGPGTPCDAFEVCFAYEPSMLPVLSDAVRFRAEHEGETVFTGVVDEFELRADEGGARVSVRGRGLAALLLDNEAEAAEYWTASLSFILERHVYPYGIKQVRAASLPAASGLVVAAGASQWRVLEDYARFCGGVRPRFSPEGVLILDDKPGKSVTIGGEQAVSALSYGERRYGVISQALVKNRAWGLSSTVDNAEFQARGGSCRRVISMPRKTWFDRLRHTGEYQIARSAEDSRLLRLTLTRLFAAFPADRVRFSNGTLGLNGEFEVLESRCFASGAEAGTELTMRRLT